VQIFLQLFLVNF